MDQTIKGKIMVKRKIINIDESLCDGCELCIPSCPEGALQIIDGKARLVKESFCDGLGACLGDCPTGALTITEVTADEYDHSGVVNHLQMNAPEKVNAHIRHLTQNKDMSRYKNTGIGGCPSSTVMSFETMQSAPKVRRNVSQLQQWPIQLHLLPPNAPYFKNANIVLVADCVPFAYSDFHSDFMAGNAIAIGCPKLDDADAYIAKISRIFELSDPKSIKVVVMEVPCCSGLVSIAGQAANSAKITIPIEVIVIGIRGNIVGRRITGSEG